MPYNGYSAYKTVQNKTEEPRDIEYRLLAQVTASLISARDNPQDFAERVKSVLWNRDVWAALRIDLSDENNQLPKPLRKSLISISLWIEKETLRVIDNIGDIDAIIDVNRNIMAGLKPESVIEETPVGLA